MDNPDRFCTSVLSEKLTDPVFQSALQLVRGTLAVDAGRLVDSDQVIVFVQQRFRWQHKIAEASRLHDPDLDDITIFYCSRGNPHHGAVNGTASAIDNPPRLRFADPLKHQGHNLIKPLSRQIFSKLASFDHDCGSTLIWRPIQINFAVASEKAFCYPVPPMCTPSSPSLPLLRGPVPLSHLILRQFLNQGDRAVDATCGNGNDTLLLAELVGEQGQVWGFDVQPQAIEATRAKVDTGGFGSRVSLILAGHEEMEQHLNEPLQGVVFNLGYLPGSDRTVITRPETTGAALQQALKLLAPGGIIAVTIYPGHGGGANERRIVDGWASRIEPRAFHVWRMAQVNVQSDAPYFILIQRSR